MPGSASKGAAARPQGEAEQHGHAIQAADRPIRLTQPLEQLRGERQRRFRRKRGRNVGADGLVEGYGRHVVPDP
jgi:hypothetical protein